MDNFMGKIGELLSDEESVKQIAELAQMFMSGSSEEKASTEGTSEADSEDEKSEAAGGGLFDALGGFDFTTLLKLQEAFGAVSSNDKNTELLLALKPHLSEEKQKKIDKSVKILKLLAVWNIVKDSGLLKDFL